MSELIGYLSEVEQLNGELTIPKQLGGSTLGTKTITENDTYYAEDDGLDGYSEVTVNVPTGGGTLETITKTYTPTTSQQTEQITPSSGYDGIAEVDVTVNAIPSQYIVPTGTKSIYANGTSIDVKAYEYADVAVPNSYSAADEGKVVDNGALVAQTAHADVTPTTSDQTIDTTTNNTIKVKGDADLVAGNIRKDIEIFGVTGSYEGGGGGSDETGSFVAGSSQSNVTISVTALHSHVLMWDPTIESDDDISSAPYGTKKTLLAFADNNTGFVIYGALDANGTGFASQFTGIGRWGGNTKWNDRVEFTSSTIKIINPRVGGVANPWIDGHTINWRAW